MTQIKLIYTLDLINKGSCVTLDSGELPEELQEARGEYQALIEALYNFGTKSESLTNRKMEGGLELNI